MEHERIIYIYDYLRRFTNETKSVTISDIRNYLASIGDTMPSVVTVRRDLDRLTNMGNNIRKETGPHNVAQYSLIGKGFTFNEIRFIVDSISINKFLSPEQKKDLIHKFEGMCSSAEVRQLISRISLNGRNVPSLDLLKNLEQVHRIISNRQKIQFAYGKPDINGNMTYYNKKRDTQPVKVIYFENHFYLKCIDAETQQVRTYRIDRMKDIVAGEKTKQLPKLPEYAAAVLDMFEPACLEHVTIKAQRFLLDEMLEQLGSYASIQDMPDEPAWILVRAKIGISDSFYRWVMGYGGNIEILAPDKIRKQMGEELRKVCKRYDP